MDYFKRLAYGLAVASLSLVISSCSHSPAQNANNSDQRQETIEQIVQEDANKPKMYKDFELKSIHGKSYRLSSQIGKPIVLNFWQTTCAPCVKEMGSVERFALHYRGKVAVFAISDEEKNEVRSFVRKKGYDSIIFLIDPKEYHFKDREVYSLKTFSDYVVGPIPHTVIIDQKGEIRSVIVKAVDFMDRNGPIRRTIDELLK